MLSVKNLSEFAPSYVLQNLFQYLSTTDSQKLTNNINSVKVMLRTHLQSCPV